MVYETLLMIGLLGLVAQAFLRFGHGHGGQSGHAGHAAHTGHAGHSGHTGHNSHAGHQHSDANQQGERGAALWALLSPLALFSLCLGAGATGLLVHALLNVYWTALAAGAGALTFYLALVRPLWGLLSQFASEPSEALAGVIAQAAVAEGHFDAQGQGMVRVTIDGQWVRLLARLEDDDRLAAPAIARGDKLTVTSVDGRKNTCRVARL